MMSRTRIILGLGLLTGCVGLIDGPELTFDERAQQGTPDGSAPSDGAITSDGTITNPNDGGGDGSVACDVSRLATDAKNCGRCGHDCLGGACTAGVCESVLVKGGLAAPVNLAIDATTVYVALRGNGSVVAIAKNDGTTNAIVTGEDETRGLALDGTNLYWSNLTFPGDGGGGYWGGVFGCTLPACTDKRLVTTGDWVASVKFAGGFLYYSENNDSNVGRVKSDGTMRTSLTSANQPWTVAVDATHVYYMANGSMRRVPIAGGQSESVGPVDPGAQLGFVALDADRVYWAYGDNADLKGHVVSTLKSNLAQTQEYGTTNVGSVGVVSDGTTVVWTNQGTFDNNGTSKNDGELMACPVAGCGAGPITLQKPLMAPGAVAVDGDAIYFLIYGSNDNATNGELRRIAKP